jgi:hypothetical protein
MMEEGSPPSWSILVNPSESREKFRLDITLPNKGVQYEVQSSGETWNLRIILVSRSPNDPIVSVERMGPKSRTILISDSVLGTKSNDSVANLPDVVIALAASALGWEIAESRMFRAAETFDFGLALTDIFLSLAAQNLSN